MISWLQVFAVVVFALGASAENNSASSLKSYIGEDLFLKAETQQIFNFLTNVEKIEVNDKKNIALLIEQLRKCLVKDLCGATPNVNSSYFDPENTDAHLFLNRALQVAARENLSLSKSEVQNLFQVKNAETHQIALGQWSKVFAPEELEKMLPVIHQNSRLAFFKAFSVLTIKSPNRQKFLESIKKSMDLGLSFEFMENFKDLSIEKSEYSYLKPICNYQNEDRIKFYLKENKLQSICEA